MCAPSCTLEEPLFADFDFPYANDLKCPTRLRIVVSCILWCFMRHDVLCGVSTTRVFVCHASGGNEGADWRLLKHARTEACAVFVGIQIR